jgi:hypothetical protein
VFQVFDLILFGVLKGRPRCELPFDDDNATVKVIMKVYHDFTRTAVQPNIWEAFRAIGLEFDMRREPHVLLFDEVNRRNARAFRSCGTLT